MRHERRTTQPAPSQPPRLRKAWAATVRQSAWQRAARNQTSIGDDRNMISYFACIVASLRAQVVGVVTRRFGVRALFLSLLFAPASAAAPSVADGADETEGTGDRVETLVVRGDLSSLPSGSVPSLTGFEKSLLETPRSASTISDEMLARFNVRDIDELIAFAPGSFTQSFFGVAGSLDIRGTSGETYFRGMRRLDNPGNYPTPIGASARVDIVRGPASPIHGPAKIGGYLNFSPKSARIEETGEFINETVAEIGLDFGSWRHLMVTAEVGGPGRVASQDFGYWLYAEAENSGSYYENTDTEDVLLQASFDLDVTDSLQLQFGGMYHDHDGNQVGGWNRLSQALIDRGIYLSGQPLPLDSDGDGRISHEEFDVDGDGFSDFTPFIAGLTPGVSHRLDTTGAPVCAIGAADVFGCYPELWALTNAGTARLRGSQVNVSPEDFRRNAVTTLYFDAIFETPGGWTWRNKLFFESYDHRTEVAIGFSQFHDTWALENKLVFAKAFGTGDLRADVQLSPSIRLTNFRHGNDYTNEHFNRRDLTRPAGSLDTRLLATQIDRDYTEYYVGDYQDFGLAALVDMDWRRFNALLGVRHDILDLESRQPVEKLLLPSANHFCLDLSCVTVAAADEVSGLSWTASLSYKSPVGVVPYATFSRQATVIAGQGAEVTTSDIAAGTAFDVSTLREFGFKGSLADNALYFALAVYEQERTDRMAQSTVTNQASRTKGTEFELRWSASERLLLTFAYTRMKVTNLNTLAAGGRFTFIGAQDIPNIPPQTWYGATLAGQVLRPGKAGAARAGIPETIVSATATYDFDNGLALSASVSDVASTTAGFTKTVTLPGYTLVTAGVIYETGPWSFSATAKNLTNERYFRANFPNLFGSTIVLPELPRHYAARVVYHWR